MSTDPPDWSPDEEAAGPGDSDCNDPGSFEAELAELESSGALLLVASDVRRDTDLALCRKLFGRECETPRRRVLGLTGNEVGNVDRRLPEGAERDPGHLQIVEFEMDARAAAAAEDGATSPGVGPGDGVAGGRRLVTEDSLAEFGATIAQAVEAMAVRTDHFAPKELRVGVDSLDVLVDAYGRDEVQRFLHILRAMVRSHDGLGHVHLPASSDHQCVRTLVPLCDVLVEAREEGPTAEYRLSIVGGRSSEWLPIDEEP